MNFKIKQTLIGLVGTLALLLLIQGGMGIGELRAVNASAVDLSENWLPSIRELGTLKYEVARLRLTDARYVAMIEPVDTLDQVTERRLANLTAASKRYEETISGPEERNLWKSFKDHWGSYLARHEKIRTALMAGDKKTASAHFDASLSEFENAIKALDLSTTLNTEGAEAAVVKANAVYSQSLWTTGTLCAVALAVGIACLGFVVAGLTRPIDALVARMRTLASGDLTSPVPFLARTNEIGAIAGAVDGSRENQIRTRRLEEETAQARLSAEEQRKAGMRQMAENFEEAVGGVVATVSAAASEMQAAAQTLTATATQTAAQSTAVATAAEEAASNVATVSVAAEELGASVNEIGRQVDGSATLAQQAVSEADQTGTLVQELSTSVAKIGDVVGLISTIASQTNLLALNATIEAARAGEAGRGFAVVAAEVKELASQTAKATDEISGQIARIQGSTGQAVTAIASITMRIREINSVSTSIAAAVEEQGAATQEIVRNIAQAAAGTGEVTTNITGVASAAEETGAAASQVLASTSELSRQAEHLATEVGRFLDTVRAA